jgi:response regulator RpfG family c-di-GMP phosphodiesterase
MTREEQNGVVRAMLVELDAHSAGERNHAERVAVYATATAHELGVRDEDLVAVRRAAQLHDVGKVRVSRALLGKLGKLTDDELQALRLHADLALEVIGRFDFLGPCVPMIRHHHERWDGTGYPDSLAGEAIPLGARAIGVAEAFDTLVSGAPWMKPWTEEEALRELESCAGAQFDPEVVAAFRRVQPLIQPAAPAEP